LTIKKPDDRIKDMKALFAFVFMALSLITGSGAVISFFKWQASHNLGFLYSAAFFGISFGLFFIQTLMCSIQYIDE